MSAVKVYRFRLYDITTDHNRLSLRWATREAIEKLRGELIENTETEIDSSLLADDAPGMTARDFNPHAMQGFQRQVR